MKNLRKIMILTIFLMIMGIIFACNVCNAEVADVNGKLKIDNVDGKIGKNVSVKVLVLEDMEIDNDGLLLEFNKNGLKYVSSQVANVPNAIIMGGNRENHASGPDGFSIAITSSVEGKVKIPKGTELANVTFTVLEGDRKEEGLTLAHYKGNTKTVLAKANVLLSTDEPTPTPTPTASPSPSPTPEPSPSASPVPTKVPNNNEINSSGNKPVSLPKTGSGNILVIVIAIGILAINMIVTLFMYRKIK